MVDINDMVNEVNFHRESKLARPARAAGSNSLVERRIEFEEAAT